MPTASPKAGRGLLVLGIVFLISGVIWLITINTAIGSSQLSLGVVFMVIGNAAKRKADAAAAPSPEPDRTDTRREG